jgi:protein ImuB
MSRIACLLVVDLPVAAACRADPALVGTPLALTEQDGPHAPVIAAAHAAQARGIRPGRHSVAQARAVAADLVVRRRNHAAERSALQALADVAASLASRVEVAGDAVFLDATGATHLVTSESGLTTALVARAERVGLAARAGIAASMTTARLAARHGSGTEVVPLGTDLGFLAPLPIACLDADPTLVRTLGRWGVRHLGDLARLPIAEVGTRLGANGSALVRRARGLDERPLMPTPRPGDVDEAALLDHPIDNLEPLLFVVRGLVDRALDRLGLAGIGCTRLHLAMRLDDRSRDERTLHLAAPTRDVKTIVTLLRLDVEARPPRAAILDVVLTVVPEVVRPTQLGLFAPAGPAPERLATTLARLGVLCGHDRVGAPVVVDTHRPGVASVRPFDPTTAAGDGTARCRLVVRAVRPPAHLEVFSERDRPAFVRGRGLGGRVVDVAGPWRITAEWWSEAPCRRDYYDLELSDGGLYRCYRDLVSGHWFVDGIYD